MPSVIRNRIIKKNCMPRVPRVAQNTAKKISRGRLLKAQDFDFEGRRIKVYRKLQVRHGAARLGRASAVATSEKRKLGKRKRSLKSGGIQPTFEGPRTWRSKSRPSEHKPKLQLQVKVNGEICVSVPAKTARSQIADFLTVHRDWIDDHLQQYANLRVLHPRKEYREGEKFMFLGTELRLQIVFLNQHLSKISELASVKVKGRILQIFSPRPRGLHPCDEMAWKAKSHPEYASAITDFYKCEAQRIFRARVHFFSERMKVQPAALEFRSQKTRWGSCSATGKISLNWRLIVASQKVIDYVVVHELAHLRFYDHSRFFWRLVSSQIGDYAELRDWLSAHQFDADFLAKTSELHT